MQAFTHMFGRIMKLTSLNLLLLFVLNSLQKEGPWSSVSHSSNQNLTRQWVTAKLLVGI